MAVSTITSTSMELIEAGTRTIVLGANRIKRQRVDDQIDRKSSIPSISDNHEEDECIAKCLLLLAQDGHRKNSCHNDDYNNPTDIKFTSKKYLEDGKSGKYVYECKTCGRSFHSFQALGGHRASHKKPKNLYNEEITSYDMSWDDEDKNQLYISPLPLRMSNQNLIKSKSKMHQCGHCGAEFTSGQALGGHMRKHRSLLQGAYNVNSNLNTSGIAQDGQNTVDQTLDLTLKLDVNSSLNTPTVDEEV